MTRLRRPEFVLLLLAAAGCGRPSPSAVEVTEVRPAEPVAALPPVAAAAGDWPWWRGPDRDNRTPDQPVPETWSETENVVWKRPVPGAGHATPVLAGDLIFLATADEAAGEQKVLALDRATGDRRWETTVHRGGLMPKHPSNTHASGTPAWDGERLFVPFVNGGSTWLSALDRDGRVVWQTALGPHTAETWGGGPSPVLFDALVILPSESPKAGFLAAVHRGTGRLVWRAPRPGDSGTFATPALATLAGRPQLILHGQKKTTAYDPATGDVIWSCNGPADCAANTPTVGSGRVFVAGGYPQKEVLAIRPDGAGDVTKTHVAWKAGRGSDVPYVSSMLWHAGHLYVVSDDGIALCLDGGTGKVRWRERLRGTFWASPLLIGDRVYAGNKEGSVHVFAANPGEFEAVAENKLDEGICASPVAAGGRLYLRTTGFLYCVGRPVPAR